MESEGKFVVVYSSEQERFVTPHGLYLGEKVPAVETPERTRVIIQKLLESGTHPPPSPPSPSPIFFLLSISTLISLPLGALPTDRNKISFSHKFVVNRDRCLADASTLTVVCCVRACACVFVCACVRVRVWAHHQRAGRGG
jgi:hypothetical protein